jgi:hypothetical protein
MKVFKTSTTVILAVKGYQGVLIAKGRVVFNTIKNDLISEKIELSFK